MSGSSDKGKSNRGFRSRISPRSRFVKQGGQAGATPHEAQEQALSHGNPNRSAVNDLDSVPMSNSTSRGCSSDADADDDPVEMLQQLRLKRARLPKTGLGQVTQRIVKGTSRNVAKASHKVQATAVKIAGLERDDTGSSPTMVQKQQDKEGPSCQATAQHTHAQQQSVGYDEEAVAVVMTENEPLHHSKISEATERDPLLTVSPAHDDNDSETAAPQPRSGSALWARLRAKQDQVLFVDDMTAPEACDESAEVRKSRHQKQIQDEFRNAMEFSLTQCLLAIVVYLGIAVLAFSFVFEHWSIIDSCYFAVVSFTTIGYGDIVPTTAPSKIFTAFFALSGVACLGVALGILGNKIVDAQATAMDQASELSQYQVMSLFDSSSHRDDARAQEASTQASPKSPWYQSLFVTVYLPLFLVFFLFSWLLGNEAQWDAISTFYFCIITACTVGYGDLSPQTQLSRLFAIPVILLAVGAMGNWLSVLAEAIIDRRQASFHKRFQARELTLADLEAMDGDDDGNVTLAEYLSFMLVTMQKVEQELIDELTTQFDRLDVDGTGSLSREDLVIVAKRKLKSPRRKLELSGYKQQLLAQSRGSKEATSSTALFTSVVSSQLSTE